jgi:hypothetical protein
MEIDNFTLRSPGDLIIQTGRDTSLISSLNDTARITFQDSTYILSEGYGAIITENTVEIVPLPESPKLTLLSSRYKTPGRADTLIWPSTADRYHIRIDHKDGQSSVDTLIEDTLLTTSLPIRHLIITAQGMNEPGFFDPEKTSLEIDLEKETGLRELKDFEDRDSIQVDSRYYTFEGRLRPNVTLRIDDDSIPADSSGAFSRRKTLAEGDNRFTFILSYEDATRDTLFKTINYTGYDERMVLGDSLLGLPAFTPTQKYIFDGTIPEAEKVFIRGEEAELDEEGNFSVPLHFSRYGVHDIPLRIIFTSGYEKNISREIERIQIKNELETNLLNILRMSILGSLIYTAGFGLDFN